MLAAVRHPCRRDRIAILAPLFAALTGCNTSFWNALSSAPPATSPTSASTSQTNAIPDFGPTEYIVVAQDGTFLGRATSNYQSDSIANKLGQYGSTSGFDSMFSNISAYGSESGPYSARSTFATHPPMLYRGKEFVGYVTVDKSHWPRIDPYKLREDGAKHRFITAH